MKKSKKIILRLILNSHHKKKEQTITEYKEVIELLNQLYASIDCLEISPMLKSFFKSITSKCITLINSF